MNSDYDWAVILSIFALAFLLFLITGIPLFPVPLAIKTKSRELEEEIEKLRKEHERREMSHSKAISHLSETVDSLEWQIRLAEPFIKKQLFNLENIKASVDIGMEAKEGFQAPGGEYSLEREGERWMDMVAFSAINTDKSNMNSVFVYVPLTESLRERSILLSDLDSMGKETSLLKREGRTHINFAEEASKKVLDYVDEKKSFILCLRVARFQEQRPIAIFENDTHFISLMEPEIKYAGESTVREALFPGHIVEWVKGCADATLVDSKSFNNDPLAFFLIKSAISLNAEGKKTDVLDVIVNNRFIQQKRHKLLIESLSAYGHM